MHVKNGWFRNTKLNESDREVTVVGECLKLRFLKILVEYVKENSHGGRSMVIPDLVQF